MPSVLNDINHPQDLKRLSTTELERLSADIRDTLIETVSENGGHLASSLGAVELTIALHRVFDSPYDKLIWDVGHQSYAHKLLTGRRQSFGSLRRFQGISGFPVRSESPHDVFGTGHAGTSISAAMGMALARDLKGAGYHVVAVIGDGSLATGMALEGINHVGQRGTRMIVVLNDNALSISPSVGAISQILNQVRFDPRYEFAKRKAKRMLTRLPTGDTAWALAKWAKSRLERTLLPSSFWQQLGFVYLGPVDGHSIPDLEAALKRARNYESRPTLVHVITHKGRGHVPAEENATKFHGVPPRESSPPAPSYSQVFGQTVLRLLQEDRKVVAITAAMTDGTGLAEAAVRFPERVFDTGICEQHAVTLAAGLATQGYFPIVAIYSTFLQRAYDQIVHDVCLQDLGVVFAIDRAGIVGDDGKTHQGAFDISYLRSIPNMIIAAPKDEDELQRLLYCGIRAGRPFAIRYPRGCGTGVPLKLRPEAIRLGTGELLRDGKDLAILAIGSSVCTALAAAERLSCEGIDCSVVNARFAKPLDADLITALARRMPILTVEENSLAGGFGSAVRELVGGQHPLTRVHCLGLPDNFIEHGTQEKLRSMLDLDCDGIMRRVKVAFPELFAASYGGNGVDENEFAQNI